MGGVLGFTMEQADIKNFSPKLYRDKEYIISYWKWILRIVYFFPYLWVLNQGLCIFIDFQVWLTLET